MEGCTLMEWTVVGVLVVLIGLFATVFTVAEKLTKPINDLTLSVATLTITVSNLDSRLKKSDEDNCADHDKMWNKYEVHDRLLTDHEKRLILIEHV